MVTARNFIRYSKALCFFSAEHWMSYWYTNSQFLSNILIFIISHGHMGCLFSAVHPAQIFDNQVKRCSSRWRIFFFKINIYTIKVRLYSLVMKKKNIFKSWKVLFITLNFITQNFKKLAPWQCRLLSGLIQISIKEIPTIYVLRIPLWFQSQRDLIAIKIKLLIHIKDALYFCIYF